MTVLTKMSYDTIDKYTAGHKFTSEMSHDTVDKYTAGHKFRSKWLIDIYFS